MYWEYKTHLKLTIKVVGGFRIIQSPNVNFGITSHEKKKSWKCKSLGKLAHKNQV